MEFSNQNEKLTNFEAFVHIVKSTIGGGFLAMPEAFRNTGIIVGSFGILLIGLLVLNLMSFLVRCSQKLRSGKYAAIIAADRKSCDKGDVPATAAAAAAAAAGQNEMWLPPMEYSETVDAVFRYGARGRFARWTLLARNITEFTLIFTYYGVNIIYICIIASTFKQLVDHYPNEDNILFGLSIHYYPTIVAFVIIPIGMVSNLKALVIFSKMANIIISVGALIIVYFLCFGDDRPAESEAKMVVFPISRWSLFAGTTLCSLEGIGMLMKIENSMARPREMAGPPTYTLHISMLMIIFANATLGIMGYLRYGEKVLGSISLNLPTNDCLADVVKVMVAVGILLSYSMQLNVTADLMWPMVRSIVNRIKPGFLDTKLKWNAVLTNEEKTDSTLSKNLRRLACVYHCTRFMLIIGTLLVATVVPGIGPLISLVGSVGFSVLGLLLPVAMETVWYWDDEDDEDDNDADDFDDCDCDDVKGKRAEQPAEPSKAVHGCWNINAPTYNVGMTSLWATFTGVTDTGKSIEAKDKTSPKGKAVKKIVRHCKNTVIVALAVFALVGGTMYNVQLIAESMSAEGQPKPVM